MIAEAGAAELKLDAKLVDEVLGRSQGSEFAPVNACGQMHDSMRRAWKILEYLPRRHWNPSLKPPRNEWILYRKRPRSIPSGSLLHQAVLDRRNNPKAQYNPPNLPSNYGIEPWSNRKAAPIVTRAGSPGL